MTDTERYERLMALFEAALDQPEDERTVWLTTTCDPALRADLDSLLRQHAAPSGLLDEPLVERDNEATARGRRVGPWTIEERIGAGGMGVVYRARRADGLYDRTVALKLIAPHAALVADDTLSRRLAAERRLLARLEHDGIARLYDGGVTDDGLPYLALELVDGEPITSYAERKQLDTEARVTLFARACDAVAYAHRSLVVHRDLKPAHVLVVEEEGGEPGVKLLDFGVSALLDENGERTLLTAPHALTPAYAAPEQVLGEPVTTATDVYALGVVFYELLAGQRPYDLSGKTAPIVERLITEAEPPRPSAVGPARRQRALRGDLDTIVMKALAKEPERRYAGAEALAADLRRYLGGIPIEARPATRGYRLRKFVERHRLGVGMTAAVVVLVTALTTAYTLRLNVALDLAQTEATKAEAINQFLQSMLSSADPVRAAPGVAPESLTVAAVLREASSAIEVDLATRPAVQAAIHRTLGLTFHNLGLLQEAAPHLREAAHLRRALYPDGLHPDLLQSLEEHAELAYFLNDMALFDTLQAEITARHHERSGPRRLKYATMLAGRASSLPLAEADPLFTEALAIVREHGAASAPEAFSILHRFANRRQTLGDWTGADSVYAQAFALGETLGFADHPTLASLMSDWASNAWFLGEPAQSDSLIQQALAIQEDHLPDDHFDLAQTRSMAAGILIEAGRYDEAEPLLRRAKTVFETKQPLWWARHSIGGELGAALVGQGRDAEGEPLLRESLAAMRVQAGDDHGWTRHLARHLVEYLDARGRTPEADSLHPLVGY